MANYERRTYEPPDDVRVFDGAEDEEDVEGSRLPLLLVIALLVLAAFGGVVWLAYTQGVERGRSDSPRTIVAESGPVKEAPPAGNTGSNAYKGLKIYEQPAPSDDETETDTAPSPSPPAAVKPATPMAVPAPAPAPPPIRTTAVDTSPATMAAKSAPAAPSKPAPKKIAALPTPVAEAPLAPVEKAPAAAATPAASAPAASGAYVLQIGAYKSAEDADAAWHAYQAKHASLLSGYASDVKRVDLGDKGVWYRLRIGGFADKDTAGALCDRLKTEGSACFPAK